MLAFYREMLALRRSEEILRTGDIEFLDFPDPVLGFLRGGKILCVYNLSAEPATVSLSGTVEPLLEQGVAMSGTELTLGANGFLIGRVAD